MIKAIETVYNGYRFRSRLEARWAVFFDELEIEYKYEPQGFQMKHDVCYLPDFYIPVWDKYIEIKPMGKKLTADELNKIAHLCQYGEKTILLVLGSPWPSDYVIMPFVPCWLNYEKIVCTFPNIKDKTKYYYFAYGTSGMYMVIVKLDDKGNVIKPNLYQDFMPLNHEFRGFGNTINDFVWTWILTKEEIQQTDEPFSDSIIEAIIGDVAMNQQTPMSLAFNAARQARFEHGQVGAPSQWKR